jgi:hypothetical protein
MSQFITAPNRRSGRTGRGALALLVAGLALLASGCNNQYIAAGTCPDPQVLEGDSVQVTAAINAASDFQFHCGSTSTTMHPSRVFQWKPASSGSALITLAGGAGHTNLDTVLDVIGSDCTTEIMCNDDCNGPNSCLTMNVVAGRTYTIATGTFAALPNAVTIDLHIQVTPAAPPDGGVMATDGGISSGGTCVVPQQVLSGDNVSSVGTITANTTYQFHCGGTTRMQPSYAFQWRPQSSGTAQISLSGDAMTGTVLDVGGSDCTTSLACNANLPSSRIAMNVTAGQVYNLVAGTLLPTQSPTPVTLSILVTPNTYLDGGVISGGNTCVTQATQMLTGTVVNSVGTLSPTSLFRFHCLAMSTPQPSYTFQWRPPASGIAQVSVYEDRGTGSVLDIVGQDCNSEVACNAAPAPLASNVTMNVTAGQVYNLVVGALGAPAGMLPDAYLNIQLTPTPTPDAGTDVDASASMLDAAVAPDAGPPLCMGALSFACPRTVDCTDGSGGALTYQTSCAAELSSVPNVCGQSVISGGGTTVGVPLDPTRQCLPARMTCYGPDGSSWQCPTRWVLSSDAGATRDSACCYWDTSGATPRGACGVPSARVAAACVAPPAGAQPE